MMDSLPCGEESPGGCFADKRRRVVGCVSDCVHGFPPPQVDRSPAEADRFGCSTPIIHYVVTAEEPGKNLPRGTVGERLSHHTRPVVVTGDVLWWSAVACGHLIYVSSKAIKAI
jgi:hypothetical protein